MTTEKLNATTQKSYYGKAHVITHEDGTKELKSYSTIVCKVTPCGEFVRMWGGYSRTTANHVNDFRALFGLPALSKKEWKALPCGNGERYKVMYSNGFVTHSAGVIFDDEAAADDFAERFEASHNYIFSAWSEQIA